MTDYSYQVETTTELLLVQAEKTDLKLIARGGVADVFHHNGGIQGSFALKIYRNSSNINWDKISYQVKNPIEGMYSNIDPQPPQFAWPLSILTSKGENCGIVMPYIKREDFVTLDNWVEHHLLQQLTAENDSLSRRILILANLADLTAKLHLLKIAVVDLKPANVLVYRRTGDVCLIDCDSLRIKTKRGKIYPPTHVSPGYILPEAYSTKLDVSALGEEQDLYAFAVLAFQILNFGIHPFQGILASNISNVETNDQKAAKGLYPYGQKLSSSIAPLPQSTHAAWPKDLRDYFDAAFKPGATRPKISEWASYFRELLNKRSLARCERFPDKVQHIRFENHVCGICERQDAIKKIKPPPPQKPHSIPSVEIPYSQPQSKGLGWLLIFVLLALLLFAASS